MDKNVLIICVGVTGAIGCLGMVCMRALDQYRATVGARLRGTSGVDRRLQLRKSVADRATAGESSSGSIRSRVVPNRDDKRQHQQARLIQAGIYKPTTLSTFFALKLALMIAPPVIGILIGVGMPRGHQVYPVLLGCIGGVGGMLLPSFWLDRKIRQRHRSLRRALPDMLDLMTVCLEGGLSLQGTLQRVADELGIAHPALAGEFAIAQRETELGIPVHAALHRLSVRTGCDGFRRLTTCVRDAQRLGTDLAGALRIHADTLRDQREAEAEEAAQKASVKILIPTLLFIFPAVFVVLAGPAAIRIHESFSQSSGEAHAGASP